MAKAKPAAKAAPAPVEAPKAEAPATEKPVASRGPKGVPDTAVITLQVATNPKREGSKARERFAFYTNGMTVAEALDAGVTTPDLVYDSKHALISIDGYAVPGGVTPFKEKAPAKEKAPKTAKGGKVKAEKSEAQKAAEAQAEGETQEEKME